MRKIRVFAHMSLDGMIAAGGPNDDREYAQGGWTKPYRTQVRAATLAEAQGKSFDLLLGSRTYDLWTGFWPKVKGGQFADNLNAAKKYVVSHRPDDGGQRVVSRRIG
jgi:dihydrofolate reductase